MSLSASWRQIGERNKTPVQFGEDELELELELESGLGTQRSDL